VSLILVLAYPGSPGPTAVKRLYVCVLYCANCMFDYKVFTMLSELPLTLSTSALLLQNGCNILLLLELYVYFGIYSHGK